MKILGLIVFTIVGTFLMFCLYTLTIGGIVDKMAHGYSNKIIDIVGK